MMGMHCDGPGCDTWTTGTTGAFIRVEEFGARTEFDFCTWDCLLKFAANVEPTVVIPNE